MPTRPEITLRKAARLTMSRHVSFCISADHQTHAIAQRQEINRHRDGGVIDQRRHIAARDHFEIALPQELRHEERGYAHDRRHQLTAQRRRRLDCRRGRRRHAGADHGGDSGRADCDGVGRAAAADRADAHRSYHRRLRQCVRRADRHPLGGAQSELDAAESAEHAQHQQKRADYRERDLRQIGEHAGGVSTLIAVTTRPQLSPE